MQFLKYFSLLTFVALFFVQCNKIDFSKPESVSLAFAKAFAKNDTSYFSLADESGKKMLQSNPDIPKTDPKTLKKAECTTTDGIAKCVVCCGEAETKTTVYLKKTGEKWLVTVSPDFVDFNNPETVALAFSKAAANYDFKLAAKFCDEATAKMMTMIEGMSASVPEDKKKEGKETAKTMKSAKCVVESDKAKCTICCDKDGKDSLEPVTLAKKDGRWLVSIDKGSKENGGGSDLDSSDTTNIEENGN